MGRASLITHEFIRVYNQITVSAFVTCRTQHGFFFVSNFDRQSMFLLREMFLLSQCAQLLGPSWLFCKTGRDSTHVLSSMQVILHTEYRALCMHSDNNLLVYVFIIYPNTDEFSSKYNKSFCDQKRKSFERKCDVISKFFKVAFFVSFLKLKSNVHSLRFYN